MHGVDCLNPPSVYITEPLPMVEEMVKLLEDAGIEVEVSEVFHEYVPEDWIMEVDGIVVADSRITPESVKKARRLRIVQKFGVGVDTIPVEVCRRRGVYVCNIPGINSLDVAEFTLAAILSILHRIRERDLMAREARWDDRPKVLSERLTGKTVGIIGFGRIGRQVARLLKPFKTRVLVYDPYVNVSLVEEYGAEKVEDLTQLLKGSDIVTLHVPLTDETNRMIGRRELKLMKPDAILINTSRGAVVDEEALYDALKTGRIRAAHIDVWTTEPVPENNPILRLENAQLSLHQASWSIEFFKEAARFCAENILRVLRGLKPLNVVWEK
ncbi:phosphoglycerate dehydrogenase [Candidatus Bathyarchaeota archaeon]|nr:phosphoglycerate dehydrogenase [Candidatus Bathyarchaeota archaeon]